MKKLIATLLLVLFTTNVFGLHLSNVGGLLGYKLDPDDVVVGSMAYGILVKESNGSIWYCTDIKSSDTAEQAIFIHRYKLN